MEERQALRDSNAMSLEVGREAKGSIQTKGTNDVAGVSQVMRLPGWCALAAGLSTLALICNLALTVTIVHEARPALDGAVGEMREVFSGVDVDELNVAIRRAVKVLDLLCGDLIEC